MKKILIDVNGGDYSPTELVKGAILAIKENINYQILLFGDKEEINKILIDEKCDSDKIVVVNCTQKITNDDVPTKAIREKEDSSLVRAFNELRLNDDAVGIISAGSTGSILTGAFLKLGRIAGVSRPALCPILPTMRGGVVSIVDCGANMDCKPINLVHFALMGNIYLKKMYGIKSPKISLLNVGTENKKGNELAKKVFHILDNQNEINFVGNMEGRELLSGDYDLIVADGFDGNVLLKSAEGATYYLLKLLKDEIKSRKLSKFGALFMRKSFKNVKAKMDYSNYGGAVLLGCKKIVVKAHGNSKASSILGAIKQVIKIDEKKICEKIQKDIQTTSIVVEEE